MQKYIRFIISTFKHVSSLWIRINVGKKSDLFKPERKTHQGLESRILLPTEMNWLTRFRFLFAMALRLRDVARITMNNTDNFILTRNFLFVYFVFCSVLHCCIVLCYGVFAISLSYFIPLWLARHVRVLYTQCRSLDTDNEKDAILIMHIHLYTLRCTTLHNILLYQMYIREVSNDIWRLQVTLSPALLHEVLLFEGRISLDSKTVDNSTCFQVSCDIELRNKLLLLCIVNSYICSFRSKCKRRV